MKTIFMAVLEQLKPLIENRTLRWIDWDRGQLKKKDETGRYSLAYPCALIRMGITKAESITDKIQECTASVTVTLAFDPLSYGRTAANSPEGVRAQGLEPYDIIAEVYRRLQGLETDSFNPFSRKSQSELSHSDLFVYQIAFDCVFQDDTAEAEE